VPFFRVTQVIRARPLQKLDIGNSLPLTAQASNVSVASVCSAQCGFGIHTFYAVPVAELGAHAAKSRWDSASAFGRSEELDNRLSVAVAIPKGIETIGDGE
jgi:hypothetical protein